ncbi:MAG: DNA polymerase III subunit beta [Candidatus Omnitrophica bacterium]|nr:DNA polymerase III subunit beta [Candidatus Omnitrophota bacterium]MBU4479681.1 DNA polymerase III subunit beta [Candidatus Omnitrophota bacterium]MCG2703105.1 DNA polymerase III subunit beta [Candidatus Omnitrophota bacterium]
MKFKVSKSVLTSAIQTVEGAVATKTTLPILSNVLIEASKDKILFNTTDLDIGIIYCAKAEVIEEGNITVPAKRFADIVRELPEGEITITVRKNFNMIIDCDSCSFRLIGLPKEEFPTIPKFNNKENIILPQAVLKKLLKKVSFAMSRDETRYVLNGTLFMLKNKILRLVATDGRRLALIESALPLEINKKEVIIPIKTINELNKILKDEGQVKIIFSDNQIAFELDGTTTIVSRLIEGEFPSYEQIIPKEKQKEKQEKIHIEKDRLLSAIKRASLFTSQDSQSIKLDVFKNKLVISKMTPDIGEVKEEITMDYKGNELTVGFNPAFLMDVLKNLQNETVDFELNDAEKPGVFREVLTEENGMYVYIVLPMQLV